MPESTNESRCITASKPTRDTAATEALTLVQCHSWSLNDASPSETDYAIAETDRDVWLWHQVIDGWVQNMPHIPIISNSVYSQIRYDTIWYINVRSKVDDMASLV